ncbi:hypothetical protein PHMEG_0009048 [Phytophthora megakarya]|uniref:Uncharacterized protein n=1 Tax=Phytophthora megakarya TaxID=4795 RepID=A0A225WI03_9STRA|nr:hypothetical protein PHMEG_0009048 [Phytophthora megakarya]
MSIPETVKHYFHITEFLPSYDDEINDPLPSASPVKRRRTLLTKLGKVENVRKALQSQHNTILVEAEPSLTTYLVIQITTKWPCANIAHSPDVEVDCTKLLAGETATLNRTQRAALQSFERRDKEREDDEDREESCFDAQLQRKCKRAERQQHYTLLGSVPPTFNIVERFFSLV